MTLSCGQGLSGDDTVLEPNLDGLNHPQDVFILSLQRVVYYSVVWSAYRDFLANLAG